jgi:hypothetical protein
MQVFCFSCIVEYMEMRAADPAHISSVPDLLPICSHLVRVFKKNNRHGLHAHLQPACTDLDMPRQRTLVCTVSNVAQRVAGSALSVQPSLDRPFARQEHARVIVEKQYAVCGNCKQHLGTFWPADGTMSLSNKKILVATSPVGGAEPQVMDISRVVSFKIAHGNLSIAKHAADDWALYESEFYGRDISELDPGPDPMLISI